MTGRNSIDDCQACAGTGRVFDFDDGDTLCEECSGTGMDVTVEQEEDLDVEV